jgi:hypothetical protein
MDTDVTRSTPAPPAVQQRHRQVRDYFCEQLAACLRTASDEVVGPDGLGVVDRDYPFTAAFVVRLDGTWRAELGYSIKLDLRVFDGVAADDADTGPCIQLYRTRFLWTPV